MSGMASKVLDTLRLIRRGGRRYAMANIVPASARPILERTLDTVSIRANFNGECFGGEIMEAMREAGTALGVDRLQVLLTRTVLVRTMELLGENNPGEVLQDYDNRMPVSEALKYLREALDWVARLQDAPEASGIGENGFVACPPEKPSSP